jgi:sugar phosphate isomerase/epimerase
MQEMTRRDVMRLAALGGVGALIAGDARAAAPKNLGVQLYTVRDQIGANPEATLKAIADIGYTQVEVVGSSLTKVGPLARGLGLSPISLHVTSPLITGQWDAWKFLRASVPEGYGVTQLIADAQAQGVKYLVLPYLMAAERGGGAPYYLQLAERLNTVGEQVKKAGLQLCYHNHGFEFEPLPDGRRPLDVLMGAVKPDLVKLELDVFWVSLTGADPVALIQQYSGRIALLHLKDKAKGTPPETQESKVAPTTFTPVGGGAVDFPAVLKAAAAAGVEHYFVEQDQTQGDPIAALKQSYQYLRTL